LLLNPSRLEKIAKRSYKSLQRAIKFAKKQFEKLAIQKNFADFITKHRNKIALTNSTDRLTLDLASSQKPISFYLKNEHFEGDGNGISFQKYGAIWFGGNTIDGEEMKVAINTSRSASASRKSSTSANGKVTSSSKTEANGKTE